MNIIKVIQIFKMWHILEIFISTISNLVILNNTLYNNSFPCYTIGSVCLHDYILQTVLIENSANEDL